MRSTMLTALLIAAPLATPLAAQNLIKNGDFESGNTTGWTFSGYAIQPKILKFDTTGTGATNSFSCRAGSKQNTTPPGGCYTMQQTVALLKNVEHLLTADIAIANTYTLANAHAGNFEFWVAGKMIKRVKYTGIRSKETFRKQVCIRFTPTVSGNKILQIKLCRDWGARALTPRLHVDNIVLLRAPAHPIICPRNERKVAKALRVDFYGTSNAPFAVFGSPLKSKGQTIPGFSGTWLLPFPPISTMVVNTRFNATGTFQLNLTLPAASTALAGLPLYWQGIEANSSGLQIGTISAFGFYR